MTQTDRAIERLARLFYGRLVARLVARTGSLADAEARRPARTEPRPAR